MARVDSLPPGAKELLQTASLIERVFSHELICLVTGFPEEESLSHLSALIQSELIYQRGLYPNCEYIFGIMHHFKGILTQWSEYVGP